MGGASLPPGFRFHPTDEELVGYYLKRKTDGLEIELEVIPVVELYKFDPWELPEKSFLPSRDKEWFFFCVRDKKYPNGSRNNRATKCGYWKATGKDRKVVCQSGVIGYRKTLVFYRGRAPLGDRTNWVMHEYRIGDDGPQGSTSFQGPFALCRIIKKNEHPEKTSEADLGVASKKVCTGSSNGDFSSAIMLSDTPMVSDDMQMQTSYMCNGSNFSTPISSPYRTTVIGDYDHSSMATNPPNLWVSPDMILDSSKEYSQGHGVPESHQQFEIANLTSWQPYDQYDISSLNSNYNGDVELSDDLSRYGCASPFSFTGNYMGFFGNEDISYEGSEVWNQAQICRQSSGDGVGGDFTGLWQQEDTVM